jgi:hypothetical protein
MIDSGFPRHPKLRALARALGATVKDTGWAIVTMWGWTMDWHENGDLTGASPDEIADGAEWEGNAEQFYRALTEPRAGFGPWIDTGSACCTNRHKHGGEAHACVHDWMEHQGPLIRKREADRQRRAEERAKTREDATLSAMKEALEEAPPSDGLVSAFKFCKVPAYATKKREIDDLIRQGVSVERIMAAANDPVSRNLDFYTIINGLRPRRAGAPSSRGTLDEAMKRAQEKVSREQQKTADEF